MAAVELAQSRSSPMYKSSSVLVLSMQYSSSKSSSSQSSPLLRPRHKSESGTAGRLQMSKVESGLSEHGKRRRTLPKMTKVSSHLCPVPAKPQISLRICRKLSYMGRLRYSDNNSLSLKNCSQRTKILHFYIYLEKKAEVLWHGSVRSCFGLSVSILVRFIHTPSKYLQSIL